MPNWLYVLTDLSGNVKGEITNPHDRACSLLLNRVDTAGCRVPLYHPMGLAMADSSEKLLKVYRDYGAGYGAPIFVGPVLSSEEVADQSATSVAISAVSPMWRLSKRLLGKDKIGLAIGTPANPVEIVQIGRSILQVSNVADWTGISDGGSWTPTSPANNTWIGPLFLANAAETLANLTSTVNGFDFKLRYIEPTPSGHLWPTIAYMDAAPVIGQQRPGAIFEYGGDAPNLTGYNRKVTRENMLTGGYTATPSNENNPSYLGDPGAIATRGLFEDTVPDGGVNNEVVRQQLLSEHLYYRSRPQEIISVTCALNSRPTYGADFVVGDYVPVRATVRGTIRFDAVFRVWGVNFNVDDNGNEKQELQMVAP